MRMRKAARKSGWGPTNKVARQSARQRIVPSDSGSTAIAPAKYDNKGGVEGKTWRGWRSRSLPSSVVNRIQDTLQDLHRMGEESKVREGARLCFKWAPCEWYFGTVRTPTSSAGWWNVEWTIKQRINCSWPPQTWLWHYLCSLRLLQISDVGDACPPTVWRF